MKLLCFILAAFTALLVGCEKQPEQTEQGKEFREELVEDQITPAVAISPEEVSNVFAFSGNSTALQRDLLRQQLVGGIVEWRLQIYDISLIDDAYMITTQPLSAASTDPGMQLLRAVVFITARDEKDHAFLRAARTNDVIEVRGRVRDIILRAVLVIDPAILINLGTSSPRR